MIARMGRTALDLELVLRLLRRSEPELVTMLRHYVNQDSQWSNPDGVRDLGGQVGDQLVQLGFAVETVPQSPLSPESDWLAEVLAPGVPYDSLAPTMVASRDGVGDDRVLILGDLDTALGLEDGGQFRVQSGRAYGAGVADMKAGLVAMIWALRAIEHLGVGAPPVTIVLAGDEQAGSLGSRSVIEGVARNSRWSLCMECARAGGNIMTSRAHIGVGRIDVEGKSAHAGTSWTNGINALEGLSYLVPKFNRLSEPSDGILVSVTMAKAGSRRSLIPGEASAVLDLRASDSTTWRSLVEAVQAVADSNCPRGMKLDLRVASHRPGVVETEETRRLVALVRSLAGHQIDPPGATGSLAAGSSAFAAANGSVVLDGLGPPGGALMTAREHVELEGMIERTALFAALLHELAEPHFDGQS